MRPHVRHRAHNAAALAVHAVDAERDILTRENAFRATRRLASRRLLHVFRVSARRIGFSICIAGEYRKDEYTYADARARGKTLALREEGSIDALSLVRPETPARNKPAREEDDGDDEATTAVVSTITHARIRSSRALVYFFFFEA